MPLIRRRSEPTAGTIKERYELAALPPTSDPIAAKTVQISSAQLLPHILPTISIGDLLRFSVRSNPPNAPGILFFQGQLIKATLPPNIQAGDQLVTTVAESGNQMVLKLLDVIKPNTPLSSREAPVSSVQENILVNQLDNLIRRYPTQGGKNLASFPVPQVMDQPETVRKQLEQLFTILGSPETLIDPQALSQKLATLTDGSMLSSLRNLASELRTHLSESTPPSTERFLFFLKQELITLVAPKSGQEQGQGLGQTLEQGLGQRLEQGLEQDGIDRLRRLILALDQEMNIEKSSTPKSIRNLLRHTMSELKLAADNPDTSKTHLETALNRLQQYNLQIPDPSRLIEPKTASELQTLLTRVEQMVTAQETLARMNPVMQALGEPALLLFPFVLHGLLSHSEINFDPERGGRSGDQGKKKKKGEEEENSDNPDTTPFQRIQVSVPLPAMGAVDVDIAHRHKEILVRITVADEQVKSFLLQQSEHLTMMLQEQGFSLSEFTAEVASSGEVAAGSGSTTDWDTLTVV